MDRKLASIQRIVAIEPIPDADNIEKCTVLGWQAVITKKDGFKVGDLVVFFEIDAILPEKPEFEFLRERKYRIKTIKLRKTVSQGLVMPLSILPKKNRKEGDDVTAVVGIKKYDPAGDLEAKLAEEYARRKNSKIAKFMGKYAWYRRLFFRPKQHGFPRFIKRTDEPRIQLFPDICEREKDTLFTVTSKLDGQSGTFFLLKQPKFQFLNFKFGAKYLFGVCSRNIYLRTPNNSSYWTIARQYDIENVLKKLIENNDLIVLQGEIIGEDIRDNKYGIKGYDFYAFNLKIENRFYASADAKEMLENHGIKFVPILESNFKLRPTIPENVEYSKGKSVLAPILREGIVVRSRDNQVSFKIVNPDFLLKYGD